MEMKDFYLEMIKSNLNDQRILDNAKQSFINIIDNLNKLTTNKIKIRSILSEEGDIISEEANDKLSFAFDIERIIKLELIKLISEL